MRETDGGPAFGHGNPTQGGDPGMSLRDYFAGQALAGMVSREPCYDRTIFEVAEDAYNYADSMLFARATDD